MIDIEEALRDRQLLGSGMGDLSSWAAWITIIKSIFALPMARAERRTFAKVAGGRKPPRTPVSEAWILAGRRSGKSRIAAMIAIFIACFGDHRKHLSAGEVAYVLVLSPSRSQSRQIRDYAEGFLKSSPILAPLIDSTTGDEIRLKNGVVIATHASSFRTIRGRTMLAVILDEVAYLRSDESASPDLEIYRAVLPALATTNGLLIGISSPYRKIGLLYAKHRDHFGQDSDTLIIQAPTVALNPTIDPKIISRAMASDPEAARSEWEAGWRSDLSSLLDDAVIEAAIDYDRPLELPPRAGIRYSVFVDASANRGDAFTACAGYMDGERFICSALRGRKPPFDPASLAAAYAAFAADHSCDRVTGDQFSGDWVANAFRAAGMRYEPSPMPKSGLYLEMVPMFMRGLVSIPNDPLLIRELRLLERRVAPSGRDRVDHPQGAGSSDDRANALAGCIAIASKRAPQVQIFRHVHFAGARR